MATQKRTLLGLLFPSYFFISLAGLAIVTVATYYTVRGFYMHRALEGVKERALLVEMPIMERLRAGQPEAVAALVADTGRITATRITVVAPDGRVLADTQGRPELMDNHRDRPEIRDAIAGGAGSSRRWSHTVQQQLLYAATPMYHEGQLLGVLRAAMPVSDFDDNLKLFLNRTLLLAIGVMALTALATWLLSRHIAAPLRDMQAGAARFAAGELGSRLHIHHSSEMDALGAALNDMATQLHERFETTTRQRNESEAVLASMTEGVIALNTDLRVLALNRAAAAILHVDRNTAVNRTLLEVTLNSDLHDLASRVLSTGQPAESQAELPGATADAGVSLQLRGAVLNNAATKAIGVVLVLTDVTRLRKLESIRRDFVANVSHELRTPVTSIQGFVETLQDGAMGDPAKAQRFLAIIARQVDRLGAIIEDLLLLSRMDGDLTAALPKKESCRLRDLLDAVQQTCTAKAHDRAIRLETACPPDLTVDAHPQLLQQAITNLVTNAITYSPSGQRVEIRADRSGQQVRLAVQDWGCGIAAEHHVRIFERFYRVDKARSRELGGTGLGLAIVKHIVQAHGGTVCVESVPGQGSTFTIQIPA